jgi:hypothetical protein
MRARDHYAALRKAGGEGKPLQVLLGGIHQSAPSLKRAGIAPGDVVFPVSVYNGSLYILAGAVVDKFIELADYAIPNVKQAVPFFGVSNIEESVRYYGKGLGFEMTKQWIDDGKLRWCWLERGGAALMLQEFWKEGHHDF